MRAIQAEHVLQGVGGAAAARACEAAGVDGSSIKAWHMEYLRDGEFQTFTDIRRAWRVSLIWLDG